MKRILHIFLLLFLGVFLAACAQNSIGGFFKDAFTIQSVKIAGISLESLTLRTDISTHTLLANALNGAKISVYYKEHLIAQNALNKTALNSSQDGHFSVDTKLGFADLAKIVSDYSSVETLDFEILVALNFGENLARGVEIANAFGDDFASEAFTQRVALKIPTLAPKFSFKDMNFSVDSGFNAVLNVSDRVKYDFSDINYALKVGGREFKGVATSTLNSDNSSDISVKIAPKIFNLAESGLKNIAVELDSSVAIDGVEGRIPLHFSKEF